MAWRARQKDEEWTESIEERGRREWPSAQRPRGQWAGRAVGRIYSWMTRALCAPSCGVVKAQRCMGTFFGLAGTQGHGVPLSSLNECLLLAEKPGGGSDLGAASQVQLGPRAGLWALGGQSRYEV